jgi:hypothetical protein
MVAVSLAKLVMDEPYILGRTMPSFFILNCSVDRFIPKRDRRTARAGHHPVGVRQCRDDVSAFRLLEGLRRPPRQARRRAHVQITERDAQNGAGRQDDGALHEILQLPTFPATRSASTPPSSPTGSFRSPASSGARSARRNGDEHRDVFRSLAQRRHVTRETR